MQPDCYVRILQYSLYDDLNTISEHQTRESIEDEIINYWLSDDPAEGISSANLSTDTIAYALKLTSAMTHLTHHWPVVCPLNNSNSMMLDYHFRDSHRGHLVLLVDSEGKITAIFGDSDFTGRNHDAQQFKDLDQLRESDWFKGVLDAKLNLVCQQHINYSFKSYASDVFNLIDQVNKINTKFSPEIYMDHDDSVNFDLRIPGPNSGDHFESSVFIEDGDLIHDGMITRYIDDADPECLAIYEHIPSDLFIDLVTNGFDDSREGRIRKVLTL